MLIQWIWRKRAGSNSSSPVNCVATIARFSLYKIRKTPLALPISNRSYEGRMTDILAVTNAVRKSRTNGCKKTYSPYSRNLTPEFILVHFWLIIRRVLGFSIAWRTRRERRWEAVRTGSRRKVRLSGRKQQRRKRVEKTGGNLKIKVV